MKISAMVIFCHFGNRGSGGLVNHFVICTNIFLEIVGSYKNVKQGFVLDSKIFAELYYRAWTKCQWCWLIQFIEKMKAIILKNIIHSDGSNEKIPTKNIKCIHLFQANWSSAILKCYNFLFLRFCKFLPEI